MSFLTNPKAREYLENDAQTKNQFERKSWHLDLTLEHQVDLVSSQQHQKNFDKYIYLIHTNIVYAGGLINFYKYQVEGDFTAEKILELLQEDE